MGFYIRWMKWSQKATEIYQKLARHSILLSVFILCSFITISCRIINPTVVAPTVAAVGLAFFSYGFPQAGTCMEISIPQIVLVLIFTLVSPRDPTVSFLFIIKWTSYSFLWSHIAFSLFSYLKHLRGISIFGHHLFQIYAVSI